MEVEDFEDEILKRSYTLISEAMDKATEQVSLSNPVEAKRYTDVAESCLLVITKLFEVMDA